MESVLCEEEEGRLGAEDCSPKLSLYPGYTGGIITELIHDDWGGAEKEGGQKAVWI